MGTLTRTTPAPDSAADVMTMRTSMNEAANRADRAALERCERLIAARLGLRIRERDRADFGRAVRSRVSFLRMKSVADYEHLLQSSPPVAARATAIHEWREWGDALTNNESYFFRDQGQHFLLRDRILPELIARN